MRAYNFGVSRNNLIILPGDMPWGRGDNMGTIWKGRPQQNLGEQKTSKIRRRFSTDFDFDPKYLRNGSTEWKSEKHFINYISSPMGRKNWWTLVH